MRVTAENMALGPGVLLDHVAHVLTELRVNGGEVHVDTPRFTTRRVKLPEGLEVPERSKAAEPVNVMTVHLVRQVPAEPEGWRVVVMYGGTDGL